MKTRTLFYRILTLSLIVFLLFVMYNALFGEEKISTYSPLVGKSAPEFRLKTFDGKAISLADLKGKALLLNFWASWCNPCKLEAGSLESSYKRFSEKDVEFLAVNVLDDHESAEKFISTFGGSFPNVYDEKRKIHLDYGVEGVPETFFISPDGIVTDKYRGPLTEALISSFMQNALNYKIDSQEHNFE